MQFLLLVAALPCAIQGLQTPPAAFPTDYVESMPAFMRPARALPEERLNRVFGGWWPNDTQRGEWLSWEWEAGSEYSGVNVSFSVASSNLSQNVTRVLTSHRGEVAVPAGAPAGSVAFEVRFDFGGNFDTLGGNAGVYKAVLQYAIADTISVNPFQVWDFVFAPVGSNLTQNMTTVVCPGYCAPNYPGRVRVLSRRDSLPNETTYPDAFPPPLLPLMGYPAKAVPTDYVKNIGTQALGSYTVDMFNRPGETTVTIKGLTHTPRGNLDAAPEGALLHTMYVVADLKVLWSSPAEFKTMMMLVIGRALDLNPYQVWNVAVDGSQANGGEGDTYLPNREADPLGSVVPGYVSVYYILCQELCALNQGSGSYVDDLAPEEQEEPTTAAPTTVSPTQFPTRGPTPADGTAPPTASASGSRLVSAGEVQSVMNSLVQAGTIVAGRSITAATASAAGGGSVRVVTTLSGNLGDFTQATQDAVISAIASNLGIGVSRIRNIRAAAGSVLLSFDIVNNTNDDDSFPTWAIVLLVVVPVLAIVGIVLYFCLSSGPSPAEEKALPAEQNAPDSEQPPL